jgi:hypothetical protein
MTPGRPNRGIRHQRRNLVLGAAGAVKREAPRGQSDDSTVGDDGTPEDGDLQGALTRDRVNDDDNYTGDRPADLSRRSPGCPGRGADTKTQHHDSPEPELRKILLVSVLGVGLERGTPHRPSRRPLWPRLWPTWPRDFCPPGRK